MLSTKAPFHLEATVRVLQRRPANAVDIWEGGSYLRVLELSRGVVLVEVRNCGTIDRPDLQLSVRAGDTSDGTFGEAAAVVRRVLGLDIDPAPLHGDVGAARSVRALLQLAQETPLESVIRGFGQQRGYLYFCGLGASLLAKGVIHAAPE